MDYFIRDYQDQDYAEVLKLISIELADSGEQLPSYEVKKIVEDHIDFKNDTLRVLIKADRIIGWYRYGPWPEENKDESIHQAHLFDIAVFPKYQRQGFGRKLFNDLLIHLKKEGYNRVYSRTDLNNEKSRSFHIYMGFEILIKRKTDIIWYLDI